MRVKKGGADRGGGGGGDNNRDSIAAAEPRRITMAARMARHYGEAAQVQKILCHNATQQERVMRVYKEGGIVKGKGGIAANNLQHPCTVERNSAGGADGTTIS